MYDGESMTWDVELQPNKSALYQQLPGTWWGGKEEKEGGKERGKEEERKSW